jgi:asparagine synthase (glutamine-hydrolysing)
VVFNGCIYNHRELRKELEASGQRFETDHSDTEVLVHGWRAWGRSLFERLNAMSAAAHWNRSDAALTISRDFCGQKPLYQDFPEKHTLAFGSSAPGLWKMRGTSGLSHLTDVSGFEIRSWIRFGHEQAANYGLLPIESLRPSEILTYGDFIGRDRHSNTTRRRRTSKHAAVSHVNSLLKEAVRTHLHADVPLSVFLSGGIDSALIAGIAGSIEPSIECITVRMPVAEYDESANAAETASHLGIKHRMIDCDPDPTADLVHLIETLGLPFGDSSLLPTYWVARAARGFSKVAVSGEGADELFAGYERHRFGPWIDRLSYVPLLGRVLQSRTADETDPKSSSAKRARAARAMRYAGYLDLTSIFDEQDARSLLGSQDVIRHRLRTSPLDHDFDVYLPNDLLRKSDTASMAVALEVRAPFLDRALVREMRSVSRGNLMPNGERKGLLKQVARQYLPTHIINRPKQGFAIPIGEWFRTDYGGLRQLLHDHLRSTDPFPGLADAGVHINMAFVEQMLAEHDAAGEKSINPWHGRDHSQRLYMLLVLSIWAKWLDRVRRGDDKKPRD